MKKASPPPIADSIVDTIGNTPIVRLKCLSHLKGQYFAKLESFNPGRSSKDRIATTIIDDAEKKGLIKPGGTIIEATSGNTGLGLALVGIQRGYKVILVMPDKMAPDKMNLVKAMGCEVHVCPTEVEPDDPKSYYSVSKKLAEEIDGSFYANQYHNEANPRGHYQTTGPEIWMQTEGKITHYLAGVGTGGTISGASRYLKEQNPKVKTIGIDPKGSILAHFHKYRNMDIEAHGYKVEGVGEDIIPTNVHFDLIDEMVTVGDKESFEWTRKLALTDGILGGSSSGLAVAGMEKYFQTHQSDDVFAVVVLPDTGERYLGRVFSDAWMRANGFMPNPNSISDLLAAKSANLPPLIYLSPENTIREGLEKIRKFRMENLLIETSSGEFRLITDQQIYNEFLKGAPNSTKLSALESHPLDSIDISSSLKELKTLILEKRNLLVTDAGKIVGILTIEDLMDNLSFD